MKKLSARCHEGIVSTYFLSVLLYCTMIFAILAGNDQAKLQTMMNMKANDKYFQQEAAVVSDIRCHMANGELKEGIYETNGYAYDLEVQKGRIYAQIQSDYPETLDIVYDAEKKILTDIREIRP